MTPRIIASQQKSARLIIGLMSGTSADGVDAALVEVRGAPPQLKVELQASTTFPFKKETTSKILDAANISVGELCALNFELGELFAAAAVRLMEKAGLEAKDIDAIALSGQTVHHIPRSSGGRRSTLQIGEASVVAERTQVPVISDMRVRDVAAGGDGAPLVAYPDQLLFHDPSKNRALQNIGGIANVTFLPAEGDTLAFDTGPGNALIDLVARAVTDDPDAIDTDGSYSALGRVDPLLLEKLLDHEYLKLAPPKTTGRELFGPDMASELIEGYDSLKLLDLLATVTAFTATSIAQAYRRFLLPHHKLDEVFVGGGGCRNKTLMEELRRQLAPIEVHDFGELGIPASAREAVAFAVIANETLCGRCGNLPHATGARRPVILGKISP